MLCIAPVSFVSGRSLVLLRFGIWLWAAALRPTLLCLPCSSVGTGLLEYSVDSPKGWGASAGVYKAIIVYWSNGMLYARGSGCANTFQLSRCSTT